MDINDKLKYFRSFIVLVAGLAMMICDYVTGQDLTTSLVHLLLVLLGFFVLAEIATWAIKKALEMPMKKDLEEGAASDTEQTEDDKQQETMTEEENLQDKEK